MQTVGKRYTDDFTPEQLDILDKFHQKHMAKGANYGKMSCARALKMNDFNEDDALDFLKIMVVW